MKQWMAVLVFGLFSLGPVAQAAESGTLEVTFTGLQPGKGELVVALFRNGEHWLEGELAYRRQALAITGESQTLRFADLPFADYGLYAFHDENGNRNFDMRWFPWPKPAEGAGVSNNALRNGPPRYPDARFRFDRDGMRLNIAIKYY